MKKYTLSNFLGSALVCLLFATTTALAQGPGTIGPTPNTPSPSAVPLDGGASLLLAGGVALGLKKLRDRYRTR